MTPPSRQSTRDAKVVEASRAIKRPYFHARKSGSSPAGHGANHRGTVGVLSTTRGTVQGVEAKSRESGIVLGLGSASCVRILAHFIEAYLGQSVHCRSNGGGPRSGPHVWRRVGLRAQGGLPLGPEGRGQRLAKGSVGRGQRLRPPCEARAARAGHCGVYETHPPGWPLHAGCKHIKNGDMVNYESTTAVLRDSAHPNLALDMRTRPRPPVV